jgi:hypothetical protein
VKPGEHGGGLGVAHGEVAEVPNLVAGPQGGVPPLDEGFVHGGDAREGAAVERAGAGMAEMGVGGEEGRDSLSPGPRGAQALPAAAIASA